MQGKKRAVADTNVIISAMGWEGNEKRIIEKALSGEIILVESNSKAEELEDVLSRKKFDFIEAERKKEFIERLKKISVMAEPKERISLIKEDPQDNKVLECAAEGKADFIITGDEHLLKMKEFRGIKIVTAKEFLKQE